VSRSWKTNTDLCQTLSEAEGAETRIAQPRHQNSVSDLSIEIAPSALGDSTIAEDVTENIVRIQEVTDDIDLSLEDTDQTVNELNRTAKHLQTSLTQVRMRFV